jgi:hypothetical protein
MKAVSWYFKVYSMMRRLLPVLLGWILFPAADLSAQVTSENLEVGRYYQLELLDGTRYQGRVDSVTARMVYFTNNRSVSQSVFLAAVSRYSAEVRTEKGQALSPHGSKSWLAPTAIPMKKGELLYQNFLLEFNTLEFAVVDGLSVSTTFGLFSTLLGNPGVIPSIKYAKTYRPYRHLAVGTGGVLNWYNKKLDSGHWIPYVAHTWGHSEAQWTLGGFWIYDRQVLGVPVDQWAANPGLYVSGSKRLSNRWILGGEYAVTGHHALDYWSGGSVLVFDGASHYALVYGRYLLPKASIDFGIVGHVDTWGWLYGFPAVGYSHRF